MSAAPVPEAQTRAWTLLRHLDALSRDLVLVVGHIDRALDHLGEYPSPAGRAEVALELCRARELLLPSTSRQGRPARDLVRGGVDGDYHHDDTIQDREEIWHHDPEAGSARRMRDDW